MKLKQLLFSSLLMTAYFSNAQCPQITCPSDITVSTDPGSCDAVVTFTAPVGTDPCANGNVTFTNCGATGQQGPTQTQVNSEYSGGPLDNQVTINTQGIQEWTVPFTGTYTIEAAGASGGDINVTCTASGGLGAVMTGDLNLTQGDVIKIIVGQEGVSNGSDAGGGGGSYIVDASNNPLIIAGGGGGATNNITSCGTLLDGVDGTTANNGTSGAGGAGAGGTSGNGGNVANGGSGTAGGGLLTDGMSSGGGTGGLSFLNGGVGGTGVNNNHGGFGGGGCGWHTGGNGGGGGGYSGGGTSGQQPYTGGGGGGSFNSGSNQNNTAGVNDGHGYVNITWSGTPATTTQTAGLASGSTFPVGTTVQTFEASDGNGNTDQCSFNIIVTDNNDPVADNANLADVEADCEVTSLTAPTATDLCDGTITGVSDAVFPIDNDTVVVWTYTDAEGNAVTQNQNVVITGIDVGVSVNGATLTADNANADSYQWIDCSDSSAVTDANGQSFTPSANGDYAVIVTEGSCTDTSGCEPITTAGLDNFNNAQHISVYPNPNQGQFTINFGKEVSEAKIEVYDLQGRIVDRYEVINTASKQIDLQGQSGAFIVRITTQKGTQNLKVVVKD